MKNIRNNSYFLCFVQKSDKSKKYIYAYIWKYVYCFKFFISNITKIETELCYLGNNVS